MNTLDALAVIAQHGHPHYKTPDEEALLAEARRVVRDHVDAVEARRERERVIEAVTK